MEALPPLADELELSVFGGGYGEAVCVHVCDGEWILTDSSLNPRSREPVSIEYLRSLGVAPEHAVRLIVVTHWDDDHIRGMAKLVDACPAAQVACSAVIGRREILTFVVQQADASGGIGSGVDELRAVLQICADRGTQIQWAKANQTLYPLPPDDATRVVALSPSENAFERSFIALVEEVTGLRRGIPRRYRAPEGPNGASVATYVLAAHTVMILGADLEVSSNPDAGWEAVLQYSRPPIRASAIKVPHHGSRNAHLDEVWTELLESEPVSILTPWARGRGQLPGKADVTRLTNLSRHVYITAEPKWTLPDRATEQLISRYHRNEVREMRGWGHVRARRRPSDSEWQVEIAGDAKRLEIPST